MSDEPEDPNPSVDPTARTEVDPARAFRMAENSDSAAADVGLWTPPEPEELDPLFADYKIQQLLGRGGMGAVYKAVQTNLDRSVAIKLLPAQMAQKDPSFAERFRREAKAMAALDHPNIVTVYDFGETEAGHSYFIMEFVDGMDMHQLIHRGELDHKGALNAVSQICDALEYAHEQGFVHRDIKPANIFINQRGVLKVGDFGLAKIAGEPKTQFAGPTLTMAGTAMGTPDYAAPEQLDGREVDQRADIYSLGVMFYEMLTGQIPRGAFEPPSKKVQVDIRIDEVVLKAMAEEPERRYLSASEMRTEVDVVRTEELAVASRHRESEENEKRRRDATATTSDGSLTQSKRRPQIMRRAIFWTGAALCLTAAAIWLIINELGDSSDSSLTEQEGNVDDHQTPEPNSVSPLNLPEFPPTRPTVECRLIAIPRLTSIEDEPPEWVHEVQDADYADLVSLGPILGHNLGEFGAASLRSNGDVVAWGVDQEQSTIQALKALSHPDNVAISWKRALRSDGSAYPPSTDAQFQEEKFAAIVPNHASIYLRPNGTAANIGT
ncbi:MAG: serine/threonine-protein kinase, partial [Verrucomicrobiota bacterium]